MRKRGIPETGSTRESDLTRDKDGSWTGRRSTGVRSRVHRGGVSSEGLDMMDLIRGYRSEGVCVRLRDRNRVQAKEVSRKLCRPLT